jgi:hypothetical protein
VELCAIIADMKFRTTVQLEGKNTGLLIPDEIVEALGSGRKPAVVVTVAGHTYRSTIGSRGGRYLISVSSDIRKITGLAGGEDVDVELELDTSPREVTVPEDFQARLEAEPTVLAFFQSLSFSNQLVHTSSIDQAKTAETRERRLNKAMDTLRAGRSR